MSAGGGRLHLVYTHVNPLIVGNVRNLLEAAGIVCTVRNEFLGGGAGELPLNEVWPELWVTERDLSAANAIVEQVGRAADGPPWVCGRCDEQNDASFEVCWNCGMPRDD